MNMKTKDGFLGPAGAVLGGLVGGALGGPAGAAAGAGLGGSLGKAVDPSDNDSAPKFASTTGKIPTPDCSEAMSHADILGWRSANGMKREP
jgi:hypothetical protein